MKKMIAIAAVALFAASTSVVWAECSGDHGKVAQGGTQTITVGSLDATTATTTTTKTTKPGS